MPLISAAMKPASVRTQRDEDWDAGGPRLRQLAVVETHAVCGV